jgi:Raf kinase inhibitor-like YbhB/YbcL family protein
VPAADGRSSTRSALAGAISRVFPSRDTLATVPRRRAVPLLALLLFAACGGGDTVKGPAPKAPDAIALTSPAFASNAAIPRRYTCDGDETSPPLRWTPPPTATRSLALLVEDPDAPGGTFVHWTLYGFSAATKGLDQGAIPRGAKQGANSAGNSKYAGPCPPKGDKPHRYNFTLYALSAEPDLEAGAAPEDVRAAIAKSAIARGRLAATFKRG